jgi:integrase
MDKWRRQQRASPNPPAPKGSIGRDAVRYLKTVKHQPAYQDKEIYIRHWIAHFGKYRQRASIESAEIAAELSRLLRTKAPTTVRHYRTALLHVWEVCDGVTAANPVKATPRPKDRPAVPRAAPLAHVQRVLAAMRPSKTRARLMVILTTGIPHAQLMQLTRSDWDKRRQILRVAARSKGAGAPSRLLPLSSAAMAALEEFARQDAWGVFSQSAMRSAVARTCKGLKIPRFRPYDLRHTQGTLIYQETGDLATTARLLGHSGTATAARYAQDAFRIVDRAATAKVGPKLAKVLEMPKTGRNLTK